jgi:hypothetical protein
MDPIEATARVLHRVLGEGSAADEDEFVTRFKKHAEVVQQEADGPKPELEPAPKPEAAPGDPPPPGE